MPHYLRTLGAIALYDEAPPGPEAEPVLSDSKSLALLAYVALAPGRRVRRSHLARLLWPEVESTQARRSLRQALYYLSKRAGRELLRSEEGAVSVVEDSLEVDVWAFDRALREERLADAVALHGGAFLARYGSRAGREFETWVETQDERVRSGVKAACHELASRSIEAGELDRAVRYGRRYVELNPFDDTAQSTLLRALLARGDRVAAYRQYEAYRTLLQEELGTEPDEALAERVRVLRNEIFAEPDASGVAPSSLPRAAEGAEGGGGGPADHGGLPGHGPLRWALAGALASALLLAAISVAGWHLLRSDAALPGWEGADGVLTVRHGPDRATVVTEVRIEGGVASLRTRELPPDALVSPRGDLLAARVVTDSGPDVIVRDRTTGAPVAAAASRADERALAWAPDQSRLLIARVERLAGDRGYRDVLHVLSLEDGSVRRLEGRMSHRPRTWATWSPLGDRIAYVSPGAAGRPDVVVMDADGSRARPLTDHSGRDLTPAWSPDGRMIAFASDRAGDLDLYVVASRDGEPERVTFGPDDEVAPTWLSGDRLAFRVISEDGGELWLLDLRSRATRRLAGPIEGLGPHRSADRFPEESWIEHVRIRGGGRAMAVGQHGELEALAVTRAGDTLGASGPAVRWRSLAPDVVEIDTLPSETRGLAGPAAAVASTEGVARVVASAGGWRVDTATFRIGRTAVHDDLPVLLEEDWSDGVDEGRWRPFGDPAPSVVSRPAEGTGGGARRVLDPDGDANHLSGLVSRRAYPLDAGLTMELEVRVPLSDRIYEQVRAGFHPDTTLPPAGWARTGTPILVEVGVRGDRRRPRLRVGAEPVRPPAVDVTGPLRRHALQVEPDGRVSYALDGRLLWRSAVSEVAAHVDRSALLRIAGQSLRTDVEVGTVRLWRGVRYTIVPPPEREFRLAPHAPSRGPDARSPTADVRPP